MRRTRWSVAAAAVVSLTLLGGCGGGSDPAADESPASSVSSAVAPSEESSPSESSGPAAAQGGYDAQELLAAMKAAVAKNQSAHLTLKAGGAQAMTGEGDVSYAGDSTVMQMKMTSPSLGEGTIEMRLVDGVMYMAMPPMTPAGKFIKIDTKDPNSPFGSLGGITQGDPLATFDAFDAGLKKAVYVGSEDVDGEQMDHYVLTVDAAKAAQAQGAPATGPGASPGGDLTYDLWLDDQDLMRRIQLDTPLGGMTITTDHWGEPVTVKAPPASAIISLPGSAGSAS
jgi:hypothetical protein